MTMAGLSSINRALNLIPKRADQSHGHRLRETFVDSGVSAALEAIDHQVLYGRRGTGKTHALRYIEAATNGTQDLAIYFDLRTIGSPDGLFAGGTIAPTERTARLLVDLLGQLHTELVGAALDNDTLIADQSFVTALDRFDEAISTVRVTEEVELERSGEASEGSSASGGLAASASSLPSVQIRVDQGMSKERRASVREVRRGTERIGLVFGDVARALRDLVEALNLHRVWLLLDEWSSVPLDVQPMLAEFLVRCVFPLQRVTVKIAAIEQQSRFRMVGENGHSIGIELGADVAAGLDLDDFMVFEQNEDRARDFFRGLLYKHLVSGPDPSEGLDELQSEGDIVRQGFTDRRAFDELVRAAEGVPRDAINIAGKAGMRAGTHPISVPDVRAAARSWYQTDKVAALQSREEALQLLYWIIDHVIKSKRARGFLVNQREPVHPLMLSLFDARVLHVVRRGYSAQDEPGERYDVWVIDYGAYVDLINTKYEPQGLLPIGDERRASWVEVPTQDLRAIRRAILDIGEYAAGGESEPHNA